MTLKGQIAFVTGASQGIGAAILIALAKQGATVIGTATTESGAATITARLAEAGVVGRGLVLNVREDGQIDAAVAQIEKEFGPVSILVNNAGVTRDNLAMRMKDEDWDVVIDTNLKAVFKTSRAVMRGMMKARTGRIINISSVVGHAGNPGQANYCASKAGLVGMTKALARELGSRNITVNCVAPGFIDTRMTQALDEKQKEALASGIPLGRFGSPEDVAAAVVFLASPDAGYVTGSTIHVNGGMYMD
ncbi:3-oxoacyl-ACP reductase FabG [Propionivibrio dicarboxylicus]|uniref:3-oxoacyl-[acyl-carrier-protein] reductase n=1 Tax=Propionivibrio dicarboxylicus TaxID=83767 RepID=A0A1G8D6E7_9RHOO|nr:3-oxoacyl-ACP reductase FabG [Propionivibrio dicarboxylicus]SDH53084.1 3-oxoacyl-[acyl-carrier-protein] reductase [Propionivibrio dicarboxylicus]